MALEEITVEGGDRRVMWTLESGSLTDPSDELGETRFVVEDDREVLAIGVVTCSRTPTSTCGAYSPVRVARIVPNNRPQLYDNVRNGRQFPSTVIGDTTYESILLGNLGEEDLELEVSYSGSDAFAVREGEYRLSRGDTLHLDVSFAPPDTGHYVGSIRIRTNDLEESLVYAPIEGLALIELPSREYWWTPFSELTPERYLHLEHSDVLRRADFSSNCQVDLDDFFLFAEHFGPACDEPNWNPTFDVNDDCIIDMDDFRYFLDAYHLARSEPRDLAALLAAPEVVRIGDASYAFGAHLWRDFMPSVPPDGNPLLAHVRVGELGAEQIAPDIEACCIWVINGSDVWTTHLSDDAWSRPPNEITKMARDGPKWDTGIEVDVVVGLLDGEGNLHLVGRSEQPIARTD